MEQRILIKLYPFISVIFHILCRIFNAIRYIARGDFKGLIERISTYKKYTIFNNIKITVKDRSKKKWDIITTKHTFFVARLIAQRLKVNGFEVNILTDVPRNFCRDWYIVICPQMFTKLPPGEKRIVFQMEQSVSSRWFTDNYIQILEESLAVLEYSIGNMSFLNRKGISYSQIYHMPIGAISQYSGSFVPILEKKYDILFYGDINDSTRRRIMLDALMLHFNVYVVNEVFGNDMVAIIKQSRFVINLHYYENALLEMPRIQECLSLGTPVISESAQDQKDYPELNDVVLFFEQGSIPDMISTVQLALNKPISLEAINASVELSVSRFAFMFDRFLVSVGFLPVSHVSSMNLYLPNSYDSIVLSLPETIDRRQIFEIERPNYSILFDGIRYNPGWIGCGLSYSVLAKHILKKGKYSMITMEDDVLLFSNFESKLKIINEFLATHNEEWDIFSGIIASVHPKTKIISVKIFKDITFVTIDKMTSMVFNIYGEKALNILASWDPENFDAVSNTIDRYIENQNDIRVVVTLPFLVGHREEVYSTLWGFKNVQYASMIKNSEQILLNKMQKFLVENQINI